MTENKSRKVKIEITKPIKINVSMNLGSEKKHAKHANKNNLKKPSRTVINEATDKFSLPVLKPLSSAVFKKYCVISPYSRFLKKTEKDRRQKHRSINLQEKYQIAYYDLRKRLHTDDPPDDCKALTDIDPDFFKCVDGSMLTSVIAPFKSLRPMINSRLRTKQEIGYRNDCILNIELNQKHEKKIYDETVNRYMEQVKFLDEFISFDYQKSMNSLNEWEFVKTAVNKKINEFKHLATREFTLISKIIGLDYRYSLQQKYGRFLYYLSPPSWRGKNRDFAHSVEIEEKGFDLGNSSEEDKFAVIFEKLKRECTRGLVKPVLYFDQPHDLVDLFISFEKQNLHHFSHVFKNSHAMFLMKGIKLFKDIIKFEGSDALKDIQELEKEIEFCENHCNQLETKFYNILHGLFYESVGTTKVLRFRTHLKFCYERVFNETPTNLGLMGVAKALEESYMMYNQRLDDITSNKIKSAVVQYENAERQKYINAVKASRELRMFERLEHKLLQAFKPSATQVVLPPIASRRKVTRKGFPKKAINRSFDKKQSLSESQYEYLRLFTDWNEHEDPTKFLSP